MICTIAIGPLAQGGSSICHMTEPHWKIIYPSLCLHGLNYSFSFISLPGELLKKDCSMYTPNPGFCQEPITFAGNQVTYQ